MTVYLFECLKCGKVHQEIETGVPINDTGCDCHDAMIFRGEK